MAKGLRSSVKKANRSKLRANVFGPVENERAERIHAKLLETLQAPKPEPPKKAAMEIDSEESAAAPKDTEAMDVDGAASTTSKAPKKRNNNDKTKSKRKIKPRNQIAFPKSKGKGALKPFSDSKVRKRSRS